MMMYQPQPQVKNSSITVKVLEWLVQIRKRLGYYSTFLLFFIYLSISGANAERRTAATSRARQLCGRSQQSDGQKESTRQGTRYNFLISSNRRSKELDP